MRITDAQVHVWEVHREEPEPHTFPFATLEKEIKQAGVDRAVLIPTSFKGYDVDAANEYILQKTAANPDKYATILLIDPNRPDEAERIEKHAQRPGMKGFRLNRYTGKLEALDPLFNVARKHGMPVAALVNRGTINTLLPLLERHPDVTFLLDHVALPAEGPDPWADLDKVLAAAKYKNLVVKSSSISRWSKEKYPFKDVQGHIRRLYDTYGPQRMAWGSDFSWIVGKQPYHEGLDLFRKACDFLTESDKEWIFDKTLSKAMKWE